MKQVLKKQKLCFEEVRAQNEERQSDKIFVLVLYKINTYLKGERLSGMFVGL